MGNPRLEYRTLKAKPVLGYEAPFQYPMRHVFCTSFRKFGDNQPGEVARPALLGARNSPIYYTHSG